MKHQKLSFNNIKGMLSRDEMKKIMAGSGCSSGPCSVYVPGQGTYSGYCGNLGWLNGCECITSYGDYNPSGGTSHCAV